MNCRRVRARLHAASAHAPELRRHLASCEACAAYSRRLEEIHASLGDHRSRATPPAGFAARVQARLPREDDPLGWAALRLLPAALGLVLLLSWLNWQQGAAAEDSMSDPTSAVLSWTLEPAAGENGS